MNKRASEPAITMIASVLVLIIVFMVYSFFFVFQTSREIEVIEQIEQKGNIALLNFVKLNNNLILNSVKNSDYTELKQEFEKLYYLGECVNLQINREILRKDDCRFEKTSSIKGEAPRQASFNKDVLSDRTEFQIQIPDYNNQAVDITLKIKNE